ncbi:MAG: hypothetical protein Tsb0020_25410 [Haliangiales bacterium]
MSERSTVDSIPADIAAFLSVFDEHLSELSFPDVDGELLRRQVAEVSRESDALARLSEQLREQRQAVERAEATLRRLAERGLAYAKVYADGDPALSAALDELSLGAAPASKPSRKRRGRGKGKAKAAGEAGEVGEVGDGKAGDGRAATAELPFARAGVVVSERKARSAAKGGAEAAA